MKIFKRTQFLPEPLDAGWPVTGYKQVLPEHKSLLPKITREQIEEYFLYILAGINLTLAIMLHVFFYHHKCGTRDLKGLRVDSPCDHLFKTAIDII